jgi:hypothetical protein
MAQFVHSQTHLHLSKQDNVPGSQKRFTADPFEIDVTAFEHFCGHIAVAKKSCFLFCRGFASVTPQTIL